MPKPRRYRLQEIINCASCINFVNRNIHGDPGYRCDKYTSLTINPYYNDDGFVNFEPEPNGCCDEWEKE